MVRKGKGVAGRAGLTAMLESLDDSVGHFRVVALSALVPCAAAP